MTNKQTANSKVPELKVWYNTKFTGHYPVGTAAIVKAATAKEAAAILNVALKQENLPGDAKTKDMKEFKEFVLILNNGDY